MTNAMKRAFTLIFPLLLAGCPSGEVTLDDTGSYYNPDSGLDSMRLHDITTADQLAADGGEADSGGQNADTGNVPRDSFVPADTQQQQQDQGSTGVGGPCPCSGNLYCYNGKCVSRCTAPTDPCQASSTCSADERCVELTTVLIYICLPTNLSLGDPCGLQAFCPNNTICASYSTPNNPGSPTCLPLCSQVGSSCGSSGGECVGTTDGCLFCTQP